MELISRRKMKRNHIQSLHEMEALADVLSLIGSTNSGWHIKEHYEKQKQEYARAHAHTHTQMYLE